MGICYGRCDNWRCVRSDGQGALHNRVSAYDFMSEEDTFNERKRMSVVVV